MDILKFAAETNKVFEAFQSKKWAKMILEVNENFKVLGKYMPLTGSDCYNSYIEFEDGSEEIIVEYSQWLYQKSQLIVSGFIM